MHIYLLKRNKYIDLSLSPFGANPHGYWLCMGDEAPLLSSPFISF